MARIPDVTDIRRRTPDGQAPVTGINTGGIGTAVAQGGSQIAREVLEMQQRKAEFEASSATSKFLIGKTRLDSAFDQDEDYGSMVDRYTQEARELMGQQAEQISDPRVRRQWAEQQEVRIAQGIEQIRAKAWATEVDFKRAETEEQLAELREVVINGGGIEANEAARKLLDAAAGADYFTEEEAGEVFRAWKHSAAAGWIEAIPPERRVEALKSPQAENLPSDVRSRLLREAEEAALAQKAEDQVTAWIQEGKTDAEIYFETQKITNHKLKDEINRRADYQLSRLRRAELQQQEIVFDQHYPRILSGDLRVDDIPKEEMEVIRTNPEMVRSLFVAEDHAYRPPAVSNPAAVEVLVMAQRQGDVTGDYSQLKRVFMERAHELSNADKRVWMNSSVEAGLPEPYKTITIKQDMIRRKMASLGMPTRGNATEKIDVVNGRLAEWIEQQWESNGKMPSDREIEERTDKLLLETSSAPGALWGTTTKRLYELDDETMSETVERMRKDNPQLFRQTINQLGGDMDQIDPLDFIQVYEENARAQTQ